MNGLHSKRAVIIGTMLVIAGIFIVGADWAGETIHQFFHSYFADIAIPFGYYFLLGLIEDRFAPLKKWQAKAGVVFALCALFETLQYFGVYALATVFDPLDYMMYAIGVFIGAFFDRIVFTRIFYFWK